MSTFRFLTSSRPDLVLGQPGSEAVLLPLQRALVDHFETPCEGRFCHPVGREIPPIVFDASETMFGRQTLEETRRQDRRIGFVEMTLHALFAERYLIHSRGI